MVRDCNTLLNALVRGTKTEAEKGFLPNRRKDGMLEETWYNTRLAVH